MINHENITFLLENSDFSELQRKRIAKELHQVCEFSDPSIKLMLIAPLTGLILRVEILATFFKNKAINSKKSLFFHVFLDKKYPFQSPKLLCITKFCEPSLADGRDFTEVLLKKPWNPRVVLLDIVKKIPEFLNTLLVFIELEDSFSLQNLGNFYLGEQYDLNSFLNNPGIAVFPALELLDLEKKVFRYLAITEAYFLTFEPRNSENQSEVTLVSFAALTSLLQINRQKASKSGSSLIILSFHDYKRKEGLLQILSLNEEGKFVELLLRNMRKFRVLTRKSAKKSPDLSLEDVTVNAFRGLNREELLRTIEELEKRARIRMDAETMDTSMRLYQQAIEYFSALNDELYDVYLKKLRDFLQKPIVQEFLANKEDPNYVLERNQRSVFKENQEKAEKIPGNPGDSQGKPGKNEENAGFHAESKAKEGSSVEEEVKESGESREKPEETLGNYNL